MHKKTLVSWSIAFILFLALAGCFTFERILQPESVMTGDSFTTQATVKVFGDPFWQLDKSPHYAIIGVLIPDDFTVDSVYYFPGDPGDIGPNTCAFLHPDSSDGEPDGQQNYWTDSLSYHYPPAEGMHWEVYQSLTKDSTSIDTSFVELFIEMTAGIDTGSYHIGYFVSNAALDFSDPNWSEASLDNPVQVVANQPPLLMIEYVLHMYEDGDLYFPISELYPYVEDEDPDSLLVIDVKSTDYIQVTHLGDTLLFRGAENWFGYDTLDVIVSDTKGLRDTSALVVEVEPINDLPVFDLPDMISFKNDSSATLDMWDIVEDVETPDAELQFIFDSDTSALLWDFSEETGIVTLTAPGYSGTCWLYITAQEPFRDGAEDSVRITVEDATGIRMQSDQLIPDSYVVFQNYPNPFNPVTKIQFGLADAGTVTLEIFNTIGQRVRKQNLGYKQAGFHKVQIAGDGLVSGVYYYKIQVNDFVSVRKMLIIR